MKILKKNFTIKSYRSGSRLAGRENEWLYKVVSADGTKEIKRGFSTYREADRWLSETVRIAKIIEKGGMR